MCRFTTSLLALLLIITISLFSVPVIGQVKKDKKDEVVEFSKCWVYAGTESGFTMIAADSKNAYLGSTDADIAAVSISGGARLWSSELGGEIASNLAVGDAGVFVVTGSVSAAASKPRESTLRVLSKETGITSTTIPLAPADSFKIALDAGLVIVVARSGDVYGLDAVTAMPKWTRKPTGGVVGEPYIGGGTIVIGTIDGKILRLNSASGEIDLTVKAGSTPTAVRSTVDGRIVYGDSRGNVIAVDAGWTFRSGAQISGIYEANGALIVTSFDNFIYCLTRDSGGVVWKKRMPGRIADVSLSGANTLLIFTYGSETAVLADLKKGKTLGQISLPALMETVNIPDLTDDRSVFTANGSAFSYATKPCKSETASVK